MVRYDALPDLVGALELIGEGRLPVDALLHTVRQRLLTVEPRVHAYRRLSPALDTAVAGAGPLAGVPLAVKDLIDVQGLPTEGGSPAYHWVPVRHAPVVDRLVRAGAVVVGKAHTRELAFGITCPPTVNPWDLTRTTGGSSGGSAAALAAGLAWAALGTDTAGSVRIPAALTGVAGLKPTHGRLSVQGVMALSWTYDAVGPMARSARDVSRLYAILTGSQSEASPRRPEAIRIPAGYLDGWMAPGVQTAFESAAGIFEEAGTTSQPVDMEPFEDWTRLFRAVRLPEAYLYHKPMLESDASARLAEPGLRERLLAGQSLPAHVYIGVLRERDALRRAWVRRIRPGELVVLPTVPVTAPGESEDPVDVAGVRRDLWETLVRYTLPWNVLGWPAVTVPMGTADGLPTALQIVGRPGSERELLGAAAWYETVRGPIAFPTVV